MIFAARKAAVLLCAVFPPWFCGGYAGAQAAGPSASRAARVGGIKPPSHSILANQHESPNCIDFTGALNTRDQRYAGEPLTLNYVVVQTWFSTEPLVLPASNFVVSGRTAARTYYKSSPVVSGNPPEVKDSFYTYDRIFDMVPYYSASDSGAPAKEPNSCSGPNPTAEGIGPLLESAVPLSYRYVKPKSAGAAAIKVLRPFIQPNATSVSFSDQVGINATPRWQLMLTANPVLVPFFDKFRTQTGALNYLSLNVNVDLNNQVNANPNSSIGAIEWNRRSHEPLQRGLAFNSAIGRAQWLRIPELDVALTGVEYDFASNDVNIYYPSPSVRFPLAVLDKSGVPGVFVWKLHLGELSGYHLRNPSVNFVGSRSTFSQIANVPSQLFRGVAGTTMNVQGWGGRGLLGWMQGFTINSMYQAMIPMKDEPFTVASTSSSKPPTITLTDKTRNYVKSSIAERLGSSNFSLGVTYQYGSLPPAFWLVKNSLMVNLTLSSGSSRAE